MNDSFNTEYSDNIDSDTLSIVNTTFSSSHSSKNEKFNDEMYIEIQEYIEYNKQKEQENEIIERQKYKCNNIPQGFLSNKNNTTGCREYKCPFWRYYNGKFDESGYEIDHIDNNTCNINISNLQALCACCYSFKREKNKRKLYPSFISPKK